MIPSDLIPDGVPLSRVRGLTEAQAAKLGDLWIDTVQQLVGIYATSETTRMRLAAALGIERTGLDGIMDAAQRLAPRSRNRPAAPGWRWRRPPPITRSARCWKTPPSRSPGWRACLPT